MSSVIYVLLGLAAMSGWRLFAGPSFQDRLLAANLISGQIVLMMCWFAVQQGHAFYLDVAMIFALLSFAEVIAFVRFGTISKGETQP